MASSSYQNTDTKATQHKKNNKLNCYHINDIFNCNVSENIDKALQWNILKDKSNRKSDTCFFVEKHLVEELQEPQSTNQNERCE